MRMREAAQAFRHVDQGIIVVVRVGLNYKFFH